METSWCFFNGFFTKNYLLYGLQNKDHSLYITDYQENFKVAKINKISDTINNKLLFNEAISAILKTSDIKGVIIRGRFSVYGSSSCKSLDELLNYINKHQVIFKPIEGDGGDGIFLCKKLGDKYFWNQLEISISEIKNRIAEFDSYFVSDVILQHSYSNSIYSKSINTIRILTIKDPKSKYIYIARAAHRFGNDKSYPVDNCAKGGFTANIDIKKGTLGKAVATYFEGEFPEWYKFHPDTQALIEGVEIPNWDCIMNKVLELTAKFAYMEYIGWDIVVLPNGSITILEANDGADLKLHQVHEPLLVNPQIKAFYSFHKCL